MPTAIPAIIATIASVVSAAAAAGGTAYTIQSGIENKDEAKKKAAQQSADQQQTLAKAEQDKANAAALQNATILRNQAREKQRIDAGLGAGRQGTILTGPSGVTGSDTSTGGKSLLGQ